MEKKTKNNRTAEEIIHNELMKEGENLQEALGPVTFEEKPDFTVQDGFKKIVEKKEEQEQQQKNQKTNLHRKLAPWKKVVAACFAVAIGLFAFSLTSEANRMWWMRGVERINGDESGQVVNSDENRVETKLTDQEIAEKIEQETGMPMPRLIYCPEDMILDNYEYNAEMQYARLHYLQNEYVITLEVFGPNADLGIGITADGEIINEKTIVTPYITATLQETKAQDETNSTSYARWNYKNHEYNLIGKINIDEIERILQSIIYK